MEKDNKSGSALLRQKAEELLKKKSSKTASPFSEVESLRLIHELEVHQIELELQNEELRRAWAEAEAANDKYIRLYDFAPSGYFTLSGKGEIIELNPMAKDGLENAKKMISSNGNGEKKVSGEKEKQEYMDGGQRERAEFINYKKRVSTN
jgi:hypothetical protein